MYTVYTYISNFQDAKCKRISFQKRKGVFINNIYLYIFWKYML